MRRDALSGYALQPVVISWTVLTSETSYAEIYGRLTPAARMVALLYGVGAPWTFSVAPAQRLLARADLRVSGRRLRNKDVIEGNAELVDAGIANRVERGARKRRAPGFCR